MFKKVFIFLFISAHAFAQDIIYFRTGEIKSVKVTEVGMDEIKYNRAENLSGPLYVVHTSEIKKIKYNGGHIDTFNVAAQKPITVVAQPVYANTGFLANDNRIEIKWGSRLYYRGRGINESQLLEMIMSYPDRVSSKKMLDQYDEMKIYKGKQYVAGFLGLGLGLGAMFVGAMGYSLNSYSYQNSFYWLFGGFGIGATIGITGQVISNLNKSKRNDKAVMIATMYNNGMN